MILRLSPCPLVVGVKDGALCEVQSSGYLRVPSSIRLLPPGMTTKIRGESSADYPARSDGPCPATSISLPPTQTKIASGPGHQPPHDVSSSSRDYVYRSASSRASMRCFASATAAAS